MHHRCGVAGPDHCPLSAVTLEGSACSARPVRPGFEAGIDQYSLSLHRSGSVGHFERQGVALLLAWCRSGVHRHASPFETGHNVGSGIGDTCGDRLAGGNDRTSRNRQITADIDEIERSRRNVTGVDPLDQHLCRHQPNLPLSGKRQPDCCADRATEPAGRAQDQVVIRSGE